MRYMDPSRSFAFAAPRGLVFRETNPYLREMYKDFWHMRDDEGNIFYSNFDTQEDAEYCVAFYKRYGIETVIRHGEKWQKKAIAKYKLHEDIFTVYFINTPDLAEKREAIPYAEYMAYIRNKPKKFENNEEENIEEEKPHTLAKKNNQPRRKKIEMNS